MIWNYINPNEDAYISQYYANANFGGEPYLYTNRYQGLGDDYQALLKFDVLYNYYNGHYGDCNAYYNRWGNLSDECNYGWTHHHNHYRRPYQLRLKIYRNEIPASTTLYAYRITEDWSELGVTWNNRPAIASLPVGSAVVNAGDFGWVEMGISRFPDNINHFGLLLKCDEPFDSLLGFYSGKFSDSNYWPQLMVGRDIDFEKPTVTVSGPRVVLPSNLVRVRPDFCICD